MEIKHDSIERHVFKDAYLAVRNGKTDILADLFPKLNDNLYISFFSGPKCQCRSEIEMLTCNPYSERYTVYQTTDIIERGICNHTSPDDTTKQLVSISLLHFACFYGQKEIVEWLIDHGANICAETSPSGYTPIQMVISSQNSEHTIVDIMSLLLNKGANPSQRDPKDGDTLLHIAVRSYFCYAVELLLSHHCDIDAVDNDNQTALYLAVYYRKLDIVKVLVSHNADVNVGPPHDPVPLISAVRANWSGVYDMVKALLSTPLDNMDIENRGDKLPCNSNRRTTALHHAVKKGNLDLVTMLLNHKANVNCIDGYRSTPLLTSLMYTDSKIFKELLKFGADVNISDCSGYAVIHKAARDGKDEHVDLLLHHGGCHYDSRTKDGNTPLALACHAGHKSIALKLMNLKVNVNNSNKHKDTPLHYSAYKGCIETCKRLVELGADPNARNEADITPLWNAAYGRSRSVVKFLLQLNVSMSVASSGYAARPLREFNSKPHTPLHLAIDQCKDSYIAAMLIIAGVNLSEEKWLKSTDLEVFNKSPGSAPHVDLLRSYAESPVSLKRLCRDEIRRRLATRLADALPLLDLPSSLTDYLLIKHDLELCESGRLDLQNYKFD